MLQLHNTGKNQCRHAETAYQVLTYFDVAETDM